MTNASRILRTCAARGAAAFLPVLFCVGIAAAQEGPYVPWTGERGVTETVQQIMDRERAKPRQENILVEPEREVIHLEQPPQPNPESPAVAQWPPSSGEVRAPGSGPNAPLTVGTSFLAVARTESVYVPPDTGGAVGPTQVLCSENGRVKVFAKNGTLGPLNVDANTLFQSVRGTGSAVDPQTKYDRLSGRFLLTTITTGSPNRVLFAVSSGSTITGTSSFTFYFFQQDLVAPAGNTGQFADYDKIGVDANAVYVGANMFDLGAGTYTGSNCFVVRKSSILSGGPIQATAFRGIASAGSGLGPVYPMGVDNDDPASTEGYVAGVDGSMFGRLAFRRISDPGGTPSISGNIFLTTPTTVQPIPQPALGSTNPLDSLEHAILYDVQMRRNRATGARTLWTAHNIEVNSSGVATTGGGRNGARWYEIGSLATTPVLLQAGTVFDSAGVNPKGFIMPSCAMSGQGHAVLGATFAGNNDRAGCALASRLAGDPTGTLGAVDLAVTSVNNYNAQAVSPQRWGDMSKVDVDPTDDQTLWAFVEYCNADNSWGVRVIQVLAPPPANPTAASPASVARGAVNQAVVVTGTSTGGSAFYDTEPGFNRLQVAVDGGGVTVTNIAFDGPTQVTLTLSVAGGASTGPRTITVTNPDGQTVTSASGVIDIVDPPPGAPFCFGDGSGVPCPCANNGSAGNGCENSFSTGGANLASAGTTSPDTVVLSTTGEKPTALTVFFQGDATIAAVNYGDGLRCVGGNTRRLYVKQAVGGAASAPGGGDPSITARSAALGDTIAPGSTRLYYVAYRDPSPSFCPSPTGSGFNSTNAISITW